jgi:hypothetical protein
MDGRIDETGTLRAEEEVVDDGRALAARVVKDQEIQTIRDEVLEVHGTKPPPKPEGVTRLIYENANGIDGRFKNNWKVEKAKDIHDDWRWTLRPTTSTS